MNDLAIFVKSYPVAILELKKWAPLRSEGKSRGAT